MPVSTTRDPFSGLPIVKSDLSLRTPQARILAALVPEADTDPVSEWPLVTRAQLGVRAGYTAISGTVTRALNGIRAGSSSGDAHPGLLAREMVEGVVLDVDGSTEVNYRATAAGVLAFREYAKTHKELPVVKDASVCVNDRYKKVANSNVSTQ